MEKYENIGLIGEGSYGVVTKCKNRDTGQIVAIKKFLETEDDPNVKKIALREIRMLKRLRHENLINLIEVFRRRRKLYLVFEFMDHTILNELELSPGGLDEDVARRHIFQVLRALAFCHNNNVIHRDVKPENVLVSKLGVIKLCDFGFARATASPGELYTDYVATRWYRAPELLLGDINYGKEVDIWATGCLYTEMLTGDPLFPGDSDIDQIFHIVKSLGPLCLRHRELMSRNPAYNNININTNSSNQGLQNMFPTWSNQSLSFVSQCLQVDPAKRSLGDTLLSSSLFSQDGLSSWFVQEISRRIVEEKGINPLLKKTPLQSNRNITNRPKDSNNSLDEKGFQAKIRRLSDHDTLFDDVLKKANMYSEKYSKPERLASREPSAQSELRSPLSLPSPGYVASPGRTVRLPKDPLRELSVSENNERWRSPLDSKPEPTEKFGFLEKAFERAFQFEEGPSSFNLNSLNNTKKEADRLQSVGGKEKQKVWLPSVTGATGRGGLQVLGKKPNPSRSTVLEGRSQKEPVLQRRGRPNLPHV